MPRYYFDIDGVADDKGRDLATADEARGMARQLLADSLATTTVGNGHYKSWSCVIRNGQNTEALRVIVALLVEDLSQPNQGSIVFQPT